MVDVRRLRHLRAAPVALVRHGSHHLRLRSDVRDVPLVHRSGVLRRHHLLLQRNRVDNDVCIDEVVQVVEPFLMRSTAVAELVEGGAIELLLADLERVVLGDSHCAVVLLTAHCAAQVGLELTAIAAVELLNGCLIAHLSSHAARRFKSIRGAVAHFDLVTRTGVHDAGVLGLLVIVEGSSSAAYILVLLSQTAAGLLEDACVSTSQECVFLKASLGWVVDHSLLLTETGQSIVSDFKHALTTSVEHIALSNLHLFLSDQERVLGVRTCKYLVFTADVVAGTVLLRWVRIVCVYIDAVKVGESRRNHGGNGPVSDATGGSRGDL